MFKNLCDYDEGDDGFFNKQIRVLTISTYFEGVENIFISSYNSTEDLVYSYSFITPPIEYKGHLLRIGKQRWGQLPNILANNSKLCDCDLFGTVALIIEDEDRLTYEELRDIIISCN
jgi:hypothetical protein